MLNRLSKVLVLGLMLASPAMVQAASAAARAACPGSCTECARCPLC
jgi:hypothetical protein